MFRSAGRSATGTGSPAVQARDLAVRYGREVAVRAESLTLPAGAVTALIGPNGSGKTSLLNAVAGLVDYDGDLTVLGRRPPASRRQVAYVLQATEVNELVPLTVREVVTMGRYAVRGPVARLSGHDRDVVAEALARLELDGLAGRHVTELSGGQRQRVFVAQGLVQEAQLLLLDEPASGLDFVSEEVIATTIAAERAAGHTVIVSTHEFADAQAADHVVLLAGRVVAAGPPGQVLTHDLVADAYGGHAHVMDDGTVLIDDPHLHHHGAEHLHH